MNDLRSPGTSPQPQTPHGSAAATAVRGESLRGHIDGIDPQGLLEGWAVDAAAPHRPVEVRVLDGERLLAIGPADRMRADVKAAGFGDGFCGFSLSLPEDVFDGRPHSIRVVARSSATAPKLLGTLTEPLAPISGQHRARERAIAPGRMAPPAPGKTLQTLHRGFVDESLTAALARIDELERSHRAMGVQRDALQAQLRLLGERLSQDLNALAGSPLADEARGYLGSIVRSMSLTRRRDLWLGELSRRGLSGNIFGTMPHDGAPGPLCVLVWGSGGIGDLLYLGTIVRELFLMLGNCQIFVLHENPAVHEVMAGNPFVAGTLFLEGPNLPEFVHTVHMLDVFDLVAEVRYCVTYTTPPLSRAPRDFVNTASYRAAEWQRFVRYQWPHLNNVFANEVMARGLNKLGLVGMTSSLPIQADSEVDFFIPDWFADIVPELSGIAFATIHHGSDKKMAAAGGVQTKNLPTQAWNKIAAGIAASGLKVVQLGEAHETLVDGVDIDLRGKTSLIETAFMLKMASVHVDTEGGLVHLARAMNTRSVVAFGPTPVGFFGYPQNDNIAPPVCGNCWWTSNRWATQCPRDLPEPECMSAHSPALLAERALQRIAPARRMDVTAARALPAADVLATIRDTIAAVATRTTRGAVLLAPGADAQLIADLAPLGETRFYVPAESFGHAHSAFGHARLVMPYGGGSLPCNTGALDWAVAIGCDPNASTFVPTVLELVRALRPDARLLLALLADTVPSTEDLRWTLDLAQSRQIGGKYAITWPSHIDGVGGAATVPAGHGILLDLADPTAIASGRVAMSEQVTAAIASAEAKAAAAATAAAETQAEAMAQAVLAASMPPGTPTPDAPTMVEPTLDAVVPRRGATAPLAGKGRRTTKPAAPAAGGDA